MSGETNLDALLRGMSATLHPGSFVFVTRPEGDVPAGLDPIMTFREAEGLTLIVAQEAAVRAGLPHEFPSVLITLNVHSALDAVGFLARVTTCLAAEGMGVNPVAWFYHDHLFVPVDRAQDALAALERLAQDS